MVSGRRNKIKARVASGEHQKKIASDYNGAIGTIRNIKYSNWPTSSYKLILDQAIRDENKKNGSEVGRGISFLNYYKNDVDRRKDLAMYNSIQYIKNEFAKGVSKKALAREFNTIEYRIEQIVKDQWPEPEIIPVMKGEQ